jgi:hypothetical protein
MRPCLVVISAFAAAALLAAAAPPASPAGSDPTAAPTPPSPPVGEMKAKEKANRTKCSSNLRVLDPTCDTSGGTESGGGKMKAKEKGNRTKCSSNLRLAGGEPEDCDDSDAAAPDALKVKEKGNRTKCSSNLRTGHGTGGGEGHGMGGGEGETGKLAKGGKSKSWQDASDPDVCAAEKTRHDTVKNAIGNIR